MVDSRERNLRSALTRGTLCRCPRCGEGKLFDGFLKVAETCDRCGESLGHARADDFPPYISITIVGHVIVAAIMHFEMSQPLSPMMYLITMLPAAVIMSLALLRPIKGFVVGMQWATRMHGFGAEPVSNASN